MGKAEVDLANIFIPMKSDPARPPGSLFSKNTNAKLLHTQGPIPHRRKLIVVGIIRLPVTCIIIAVGIIRLPV